MENEIFDFTCRGYDFRVIMSPDGRVLSAVSQPTKKGGRYSYIEKVW